MPTNADPVAAEAVNSYLVASDTALASARALREAWQLFFQENGLQPSEQRMAEFAVQQQTSDLALQFARQVVAGLQPLPESIVRPGSEQTYVPAPPAHATRRRGPVNKLLWRLGRSGQKTLRIALFLLMSVSGLAASAAGISITMEIAGYLHLIDDPVQLPLGIQLAVFVASVVVFLVARKILIRVERLLFGGKKSRSRPLAL